MQIIDTHIVEYLEGPSRLSDYLAGVFEAIPSRKGIKKAIKKGAVFVDGALANTGHWVKEGQVIALYEIGEQAPKVLPLKIEVLYEDDELAVVNKPAGLVVSGNQYRTLVNALSFNLKPSAAIDAYAWPRPVHRLDAPTSGLVIIAKTRKAQLGLSTQFEAQTVQKEYQAVVIGNTARFGNIDLTLDGKQAYTSYQTLHQGRSLKNDWLSLLLLSPKTGRTHQLRRHMAAIHCPILGDSVYGKEGFILRGKGLFLCACSISFMHPVSEKPLYFSREAPKKFAKFMEREQQRWDQQCISDKSDRP